MVRTDLLLLLIALALVAVVLVRHVTRTSRPSTSSQEPQNIQTVVNHVREQLEVIDRERRHQGLAPVFELDAFVLDLSFVVKERESSGVGARLEVVTLDSAHEVAREAVQRIQLQWKPYQRSGDAYPETDGELREDL